MEKDHEIVQAVYAAKEDNQAATFPLSGLKALSL